MVDANEFFREMTLRICSTLEIEEALQRSLVYLQQHIPAYALYLERYEPRLAGMRCVARATVEEATKLNIVVSLSLPARQAMVELKHTYLERGLPPILLINDPHEAVTESMLASLGEPPSSVLSLPLIVGGQVMGALVALAEGPDRFTDEHARLFAVLKEPFFVALSNTLRYQEVVRLRDSLAEENRNLHRELHGLSRHEIVGADFGLRDVMVLAHQVAKQNSPVLLLGETGVGKDLIARTIHNASPRRDGPFIPVNCGAIPDSLIDSELFGHEKGAFTGALHTKRGRFERAQKGTIFLDEVGELPPPAQVRLLRVLQEREIERVGGTETIPIDIRVVAATNRDLETMVDAGDFRRDLWFRLNVFPITIPPLRERPEDIPALIEFFVRRKTRDLKLAQTPDLAPDVIDKLMAYEWPGNVRELENLVERAMIIRPEGPLSFQLGAQPAPADIAPPSALDEDGSLPSLDEAMRVHILRALALCDGRIHGTGGAAELLGLNPNTLRGRMAKLGVSFKKDKEEDSSLPQ